MFSIPLMTFRLIIFGERWGISVVKAMALSEGLDVTCDQAALIFFVAVERYA